MNTNKNDTEQLLCRNNCGFYGHPNFDNYCSKCYHEIYDQRDVKSSEIVYNSNKYEETSASSPVQIKKQKSYGYPDSYIFSSSLPTKSLEQSYSTGTSPSSYQENIFAKKKRQICAAEGCKKKLLLTSVECRCGKKFCSSHRYAEQHNCEYDYKSSQKSRLNKENPVVAPSKINPI